MQFEFGKSFCSPKHLAKLVGLSPMTFYRLRKEGKWTEGVHWNYVRPEQPCSGIRYNTDLCVHWFETRGCPVEHNRAVAAYLLRRRNLAECND